MHWKKRKNNQYSSFQKPAKNSWNWLVIFMPATIWRILRCDATTGNGKCRKYTKVGVKKTPINALEKEEKQSIFVFSESRVNFFTLPFGRTRNHPSSLKPATHCLNLIHLFSQIVIFGKDIEVCIAASVFKSSNGYWKDPSLSPIRFGRK